MPYTDPRAYGELLSMSADAVFVEVAENVLFGYLTAVSADSTTINVAGELKG